ncbi:MAG: hypothetical protein HON53_23335 [Planctomycetaceae bacterium]|jgi:hypothetical protein|nr:hypothetical protein [Planctomycetaceae bacterium]MBT6156201.1 hypothetical protein [Planctomycetaceae bacterium]MBT6487140.1 hypothetical protein [Planctomycetaceae bacterium]MBT6494751.1 hypothetical protein [Planctomycetaceae bacterium]
MADSDASSIDSQPVACPCCGYATLDERGGWEICDICWWEDDGQDNHNATMVAGGPNANVSLARARLNFITDGIFHPERVDLRKQQVPTDGIDQLRTFTYSSDTQTLAESGTDWSVLLAQLDDDSATSFFASGDGVVYRRRYLDTVMLPGVIDIVEWSAKLAQWIYRLNDADGRPVAKTFTATDLEHDTPKHVG